MSYWLTDGELRDVLRVSASDGCETKRSLAMAETQHAPVSEEHRRAEQALLSKVIDAVRQFPLGHNHWDRTMRHGAGCELCIQQLEAKNKLMDLLRESPMKLLADALRDERVKEAEWFLAVDIIDVDTEQQWKRLVVERIAKLKEGKL